MRDHNIKIEPFEILNLLSLSGEQEVNTHGTVTFSGIIPNDKTFEYLSMGFGSTWVEISAITDEDDEHLWFNGVITSLEIESTNDVNVLSVTAKTGSFLMDSMLHTRSYQESSITYDDILASYTNDYPEGNFIMKQGTGEAINDLIMQYRETDWAFTKRLASHFNCVVIPDSKVGGVKYYFGVQPSSSVATIDTRIFKMHINMEEFKYKRSRNVNISEQDMLYHILRHRDIFSLGDQITLNGKGLYISRITTEFEGYELWHVYHLKSLAGFVLPKEYNLCAIGASFAGKISDIMRDLVKISLTNDENAVNTGTRWFPYSTVYSSPDGTGWYAMPEIGDEIRMYCPDEDEAGAYVISSTHLESSDSSERANPDFKSIMNKHHKEILFTPDSLIITNNAGMSISLMDDEGIRIVSDKDVFIQSDKLIQIVSTENNISVLAPDEILLKQGETITQIRENIAFAGAQVRME